MSMNPLPVIDNREAIFRWLDERNPRPVVRRAIEIAYNSTWAGLPWEQESDGISWVIDLEVTVTLKDGTKKKVSNPAGVTHDLAYRAGRLMPWVGLRWSERDMREYADTWYGWALHDLGYHFHDVTQTMGLYWFGWYAWRKNRQRDAQTARLLRIGKSNWTATPSLDDVI